MKRECVTLFDLSTEVSKKFPNAPVRDIINCYLEEKEKLLVEGKSIKEPIGVSMITLRRVSSPKMFNKTELSSRSVKVVTEINSKVSGKLILRSLNDEEFSKLLSNGRI